MEERAGLRELLVELEFEFLHAPAEEDPHIDLVEQCPLEMPLPQHFIAEGVEG